MVGGDHVDRAVGDPGAQRVAILGGAQRRVHLEVRVVADQIVVGEDQVVRGDFGRHPDPVVPSPV